MPNMVFLIIYVAVQELNEIVALAKANATTEVWPTVLLASFA